MTWKRIVRSGAWLLLFGIAIVQFSAALVDEPYIPLKADQYRIQSTNADERGVERLKDAQVFVRYDLWTPIPMLWTSAISLCALFTWAATGPRPPSPG